MLDQPHAPGAAPPQQHDIAPPPAAQAQAPTSLDAILAQGQPTPQRVADYLKAHPNEKDAAVAKLHQRFGNQFVNEVLALIRPAAIAKDNDGGKADKLAPEQRSYYDSMLANDPKHADKKEQDKAQSEAAMSRPLSADDQHAISAAEAKIASMKPRRIDDGKNPNLVQIEVAFDGTGDDKATAWAQSNPAKVDDMFAGKQHTYEKGVATEGNAVEKGFEFATGAGMQQRIDGAYNNLVAQINDLKSANPKAEVVLVVTGFSRGAAEARAFTNTLNKRGIPVQSSKQPDGSFTKHYDTPRVGVMVLFDTVEMSAVGKYDMSIPPNVENVLQLTAKDEKRTLFPLTSVQDKNRPDDDRINEVALPGTHSDIGGGHRNAYSQIPLQMARTYMENAGVQLKPQDPSTVVDPSDPSLRLHDTGGGFLGMKRHESYVTNPKQ